MERSREELDTRLKQQIQFIVEVDKVKNIFRQTYLADANRKENDAEHSWHLALMAVLLKDYMKEEIDLAKVMIMVLIHDLVEIDAGDTYAYDEVVQRPRENGKKRRLIVFLDYCRKIRDKNSASCGKSSKLIRLRKQNMPIFSIISSLFC